MTFRWFKRAADYDMYLDRIKQTERRKAIGEREAVYRNVTSKILGVVEKKLDLMEAGELTQGNVKDWMTAAIQTERTVFGIACDKQTDKDDGQLRRDKPARLRRRHHGLLAACHESKRLTQYLFIRLQSGKPFALGV
jgi:hypothetical protein